MKLSVVIVNYNVRHFIEQCLYSVQRAINGIEAEVFVVDNNSVDGSCYMLREKFPWVNLIQNSYNVGFAKANNQAIHQAKGEYVLLLNPDTLVQEDTFHKCLAFMDKHPDAGALGVKMIDGKGNFLPESKRSLPTPMVAFYKIFGLSRLFPNSKRFGRYHLSYLDNDKIHEVEVLSGAYMLIRKKVLDEIGLLDEAFFMYGEDIDLSYRIILAGYKNYYFPETTIVHYKGESTKKSSLNYVVVFYNAMIIFVRKHFVLKGYRNFLLFIKMAIWLRAGLSMLKRILQVISLPIADILIMFSGYLFLLPISESLKFEEGFHYPWYYITFIVPTYILIWFLSLVFAGTYDRPYKINKVIRGMGVGTLIILAIYALLPEGLRFSRLLVVSGALWSLLSLLTFRYLLHLIGINHFKIVSVDKKKVVIVADRNEYERIRHLIMQTTANVELIGYVYESNQNGSDYLGNFSQLNDIIDIYRVDEIIFSGKDIASHKIIHYMTHLNKPGLEFKIAPPEGMSIIGSNSINTAGDFYMIQFDTINTPTNRRLKRLFDFCVASIMILFSPILMIFYKNKFQFIRNIFKVWVGSYTLIGYKFVSGKEHEFIEKLPPLKKGVLTPLDGIKNKNLSEDMLFRLNFFYAKDYNFTSELNIFIKGLLYIDRKC